MVVPRLWDVARLLKLGPSQFLGIELIGLLTFIVILDATEDDCFMIKNSCLVMGDVSRDGAFLVDWLPLNAGITVQGEVIECRQIDSPHRSNWADLNISSTVDIQPV